MVGTNATSPLRHNHSPNPTADDNFEESSQDERPFTQDPSLIVFANSSSPPPEADGPNLASINNRTAAFQLVVPLSEIPDKQVEIIKEAIEDVYGFDHPRPFQIEAINHLAFDDASSLVLIRRTADGKSLVPLTVSVLRGGITLILVPLHGLGSDQVDKATVPEHGIVAYYVDEHKCENAKILVERLAHYTEEEADHNSILLFASPNLLKEGSGWMKTFSSVADKGLIRTVAVDEAHEIEQSGKSFRKDFVEASQSLQKMIQSMKRPVPCIFMSATFRPGDFDTVAQLFKLEIVAITGAFSKKRNTVRFLCGGRPGEVIVEVSSCSHDKPT